MEKYNILDLIKEIKENNKNNDVDVSSLCDYGETLYLGDLLSEIADNNVSIYTSDLLEWCKDNYSYVEDAIREYGFPNDSNNTPDLIRAIQQGQYYYNYEEITNNLYNMIKLYILDLLKDNDILQITEEEQEKLDDLVSTWENNDILGNINDIMEVLKDE